VSDVSDDEIDLGSLHEGTDSDYDEVAESSRFLLPPNLRWIRSGVESHRSE